MMPYFRPIFPRNILKQPKFKFSTTHLYVRTAQMYKTAQLEKKNLISIIGCLQQGGYCTRLSEKGAMKSDVHWVYPNHRQIYVRRAEPGFHWYQVSRIIQLANLTQHRRREQHSINNKWAMKPVDCQPFSDGGAKLCPTF